MLRIMKIPHRAVKVKATGDSKSIFKSFCCYSEIFGKICFLRKWEAMWTIDLNFRTIGFHQCVQLVFHLIFKKKWLRTAHACLMSQFGTGPQLTLSWLWDDLFVTRIWWFDHVAVTLACFVSGCPFQFLRR